MCLQEGRYHRGDLCATQLVWRTAEQCAALVRRVSHIGVVESEACSIWLVG